MKKKFYFILMLLILLAGTLMFTSCEDEEDETIDVQIKEIAISPENASFAVEETQEFSAYVIAANGDTLERDDLDIEWEWWSSDAYIFTVDQEGIARGENPGEAYCIIQATVQNATQEKAAALFTGRDSAFVSVFAF